MDAKRMATRHLTVMFTDIKGFTNKTSHKTREELLTMLEEHERLVRPLFEKFGGTVVKTIGDAFLVTFESPTDAVLCGVKIQEVLRYHNKTAHENENIEVRVAINSGEVTIRDNDVFGEPVNIAARIEGIAEVNEVYFTEAVYLAMNKSEIPSAEVGLRYLKGIPNEIKVYKVLHEPKDKLSGMSQSSRTRSFIGATGKKKTVPRWLLIALAVFLLFLVLNGAVDLFRLILIIAAYCYFAISIKTIAASFGTSRSWLAWIPLVNVFYAIAIARKPWYWHALYLIPFVNFVFIALTWIAIAEMKRKPWWSGLLILVPGINFFVPGYLAFV